MKFRSSLSTVILTFLSFGAITYTACGPGIHDVSPAAVDKCANQQCSGHGSCSDGVCTCDAGYTGTYCEESTDPCFDVVCYNGGTCNNGNCQCPTGYEGIQCESPVNQKFAGTYNVTSTCSVSGSSTYTMTIIGISGIPTQVYLSNLANTGCGINLDGFIDGNTITIDDSECGIYYTGSGTYSNNVVTLNYSSTYNSATESCTAVMTRQ